MEDNSDNSNDTTSIDKQNRPIDSIGIQNSLTEDVGEQDIMGNYSNTNSISGSSNTNSISDSSDTNRGKKARKNIDNLGLKRFMKTALSIILSLSFF